MAEKVRRGPRTGKRVGENLLAEMMIEALNSKQTMAAIIKSKEKEGFNVKKESIELLDSLKADELSYFLKVLPALKEIKSEAYKSLVDQVTSVSK